MTFLEYMVTTTCEVLGIEFNGTTDEEKQAFVDKHTEAREKEIARLLDEAYREMLVEGIK
ncbi:hypothetical protein MTP04_24680 [Lysinibacillus sp. PLM2]|nr:hypothetical protein MTP04_22680 [Lysinibacillus sp. PLM2]BDH62338.1 hypothetical protein MTP04_24680 [Lysinibacillus sp. PLM2]